MQREDSARKLHVMTGRNNAENMQKPFFVPATEKEVAA